MDERVEATITDWARVATGFVVLGAQQAQTFVREARAPTTEALRAARRLADQVTER